MGLFEEAKNISISINQYKNMINKPIFVRYIDNGLLVIFLLINNNKIFVYSKNKKISFSIDNKIFLSNDISKLFFVNDINTNENIGKLEFYLKLLSENNLLENDKMNILIKLDYLIFILDGDHKTKEYIKIFAKYPKALI